MERDSLGRERLPSEDYSQHGGSLSPRHLVWACKVCSRAWNVSSRSARYDTKCRQCGTRNTIKFTSGTGSWIKGRERVTRFYYYPSAAEARAAAIKSNRSWMANRRKKQFNHPSFVKASDINKSREELE